MLINMQLSHHLFRSSLQLTLRWRPRDENQDADDLTNGRTSSFPSELQVAETFEGLKLDLLNELWAAREDFWDRDSLKMWPAASVSGEGYKPAGTW